MGVTGTTGTYGFVLKVHPTSIILPGGVNCGDLLSIIVQDAPLGITIQPDTGILIDNGVVTSLTSNQDDAIVELVWIGTQWVIVSNNGFTVNQ